MTKVFHIFTVTPVEVGEHEVPRVQYGDYFVVGKSLQDTFGGLTEYGNVIGASEVFGSELDLTAREDGVLVRPESKLNQIESLKQHRHWSALQGRYVLLAKGAESPEDFVARRFTENRPLTA